MAKIRRGVLSTALTGVKKVIRAMQRGKDSQVTGIASRDLRKARKTARALGIPKAYGSYDEVLADPEIDAVYNPLPNHLHVPWSLRAAEAGEPVLCRKAVGVDVCQAEKPREATQLTGLQTS